MKLAKYTTAAQGNVAVGIVEGEQLRPLLLAGSSYRTLSDLLDSKDPAAVAAALVDPSAAPLDLASVALRAPVDAQEVWAAGVTYKRSCAARQEESVGAANFYDLVYQAARPELFFKAMPHRAVGTGESVRIRSDASWNVPEPELALVLNARLELVGFTIGNDMSSRDIEGENPLYLPQAKVYDQSCALGPWITLAGAMPTREAIGIRMSIGRGGETIFRGSTSIAQMARTFEDLIGYLGRDNTFARGAVLLTGTGIIPESTFTLRAGDKVEIAIDGIGSLVNTVVQG
ncbi:MAG TPA: fumarylacetoacetate hydrolase family protein [Pirellulales bacterium]|nr:fumarylacetoacetate hydrolase family protein [Pirellulales bacterium]